MITNRILKNSPPPISPLRDGTGVFYDRFADKQTYREGQAMFVSEYGGIKMGSEQHG